MQEALSQLLSPRHVTLILEALYGHRDRFRKGKYERSSLENKLVAVHGHALEGVTLEHALTQTLPPIGALVYPRFRVATLLLPDAIEFHVLSDVVHCAVDAHAWYAHMGLALPDHLRTGALVDLRGVWGSDGRFYPRGFALTDWPAG